MNIQDAIQAKRAMEEAIAVAAAVEVEKFKRRTGLSPKAVHVNMWKADVVVEKAPRYFVASVSCDVSL